MPADRPSELRFLVNPTSGGGRGLRVVERIRARAADAGAPVELSSSGPDLTARARRAVDDGIERVVVVGGDGSVHLVIQALAATSCELAVIPTGRGDDFASAIGVPAELEAALDLALSGTAREIDLLCIGFEHGPVWGGIYASFGFDSAVTHTANAQPRWIHRRVTYVLAALRTLVGFRAPRIGVDYDGGRYDRPAMLVTACNAFRYGGGMRIAPGAKMDDGLFDLVAVDRVSKLEALRILPRVFDGRHLGHPAVSVHRSAHARIAAEPPVLVGADGEVVGELGSEPMELGIARRALRVVGPG